MPIIHRSALLPLPLAAVFDVVRDVASYPEFLPWCAEATVLQAHGDEIVAELALETRGVRQRFTTRNVMIPEERIELHLVSGPFRTFEGAWHFKRLGGDEGTRVELDLRFELSGLSSMLGGAFSGLFVSAADEMVDAFCQRAMARHQGP